MKTRSMKVQWSPSTSKPNEVDASVLSSGPRFKAFCAQGTGPKDDGCAAWGLLRLLGLLCVLATVLSLRFNRGVDEYFPL
jgi:hypothetical protein